MSDEIRFLFEEFDVIVKVASVIVAVFVAWFGIDKFKTEFEASRHQRNEDLRWRKAQAGKTLNDEMMADEKADAAMTMLDWSGRKFTIDKDTEANITREEMLVALRVSHRPPQNGFSVIEGFIRDAFDSLFYRVGRFEHSITSKLVEFEDIEYPMAYYVKKLSENRPVFETYLKTYEFIHALAFLERFEAWRKASKG